MMWRTVLCLALLVVAPGAVGLETSVVGVYAKKSSGETEQGTGFWIDDVGSFVTSYHVVEGANSVRVASPGQPPLEDVLLLAFDADRDLALLQARGASSTPGLTLDAADQWLPSTRLKIVAYPRGLPGQVFVARPTQAGFLRSKQLSTVDGQLFREDFDIVSIDVTTHLGMSGSPVVVSNTSQIVGVLAGSLTPHEGGSISWVIPAKYIFNLMKRPYYRVPVSDFHAWEPLSMASNWRRLVRSYGATADGYDPVDAFYAIREIEKLDHELGSRLNHLKIESFCRSLGRRLNEYGRSLFREDWIWPTRSQRSARAEALGLRSQLDERARLNDRVREVMTRLVDLPRREDMHSEDERYLYNEIARLRREYAALHARPWEELYDVRGLLSGLDTIVDADRSAFRKKRHVEEFLDTCDDLTYRLDSLERSDLLSQEEDMLSEYRHLLATFWPYVAYPGNQ